MDELTEEQVKAILNHPFIKSAAIARDCLPDSKVPKQALRDRMKGKVSKDTIERVSASLCKLYILFPHNQEL